MTLRDLPPVRALAEERAREVHDAAVRAIKARHVGSYAQSLIDTLPPMWVDVDAHLAILCDMTRPDSRDAVARLVAERVGLVCGATAPEFRRFRLSRPDGAESWAWALLGSPGEQFVFTDGNVSNISAITDPTEALARVAIAVLA